MTTLNELISTFDTPLPDDRFPRLIESLGDEARKRSAARDQSQWNGTYFYLLARTYELLGYCARHTPWLSQSPKLYWQWAAGFYEQAREAPGLTTAQHHFLDGKFLLRTGMIHTLDRKTSHSAEGYERLAKAEIAFESAAAAESNAALQLIYRDAAAIARTEAQQRQAVDAILGMFLTRTAPWTAVMDKVDARVKAFPAQVFSDLPSAKSSDPVSPHNLLAGARKLLGEARLLDEVVTSLEAGPREQTMARRQEYERRILQCYEESASLSEKAGLSIRAAHTRVTKLRRSADGALRECRFQFSDVRKRDSERSKYLLDRTAPGLQPLPESLMPMLRAIGPDRDPKDRIAGPELVNALKEAGVSLGDDVTIFCDVADSWVISDGFDRYHVCVTDDALRLLDLTKQPIPFSHKEALLFYEYAEAIKRTCDLYMDAIRGIRGALGEARHLYEGMTAQLGIDAVATRDNDLSKLHRTTEAILKELRSRHYPLLSTLRDRIRYACSLLEMFQMRTGSVRLGTLFSAQCLLVMQNPSYDPARDEPGDELIEVGADPIFQTTVDFVFRGAKGEEDRQDFQTRALKATITTIEQERQSLLAETRWIELDPGTRRTLLARLDCHRNLALALEEFTPVFVAQSPGEIATEQIRRRLHVIGNHLRAAVVAFEASGEHRSRLIDRNGLEAISNYMDGIAMVLIGMNHQRDGQVAWRDAYRRGLESLTRAKKWLEGTGDVYLLPMTVRTEYVDYVEARILTVEGFRARYRGIETGNSGEFTKSVEDFTRSSEIFAALGDYRVATKAAARAIDSASYLEDGEAKRRALQDAIAHYAASGNALGFNDTMERLRREFPADMQPTPVYGGPRIPIAQSAEEKTVKQFGGLLLKEIGHGGMATVYETVKDGKTVALKMMLDSARGDEESRKRFVNEARVSLGLNHPNIVHVYEQGEVEGVPFFTMERLHGEPLHIPISNKRRFASRDAARIAMQLADALDYAHANRVVHRDLKPSNIMLLEDGRTVKIMDFGIAVSSDQERLTKTGMVMGTPEYMPPERLGGYEATPRTDLYGLGLIVFEMLTGESISNPLLRVMQDHPRPSAVVPEIPAALDAIVAKLLAREMKDGYQSARALLNDLKAFLGPE